METPNRFIAQFRHTMKLPALTLILGMLSLTGGLAASPTFTVNIESFRGTAGFDPLPGAIDLRVAPMTGKDRASEATHMILSGLQPAQGSSGTYISRYHGVQLPTQSEQDSGTLYLRMPAWDLPANAAAAPVVGVVARSGSWDTRLAPPPAWTTVGGAKGGATFDRANRRMVLQLNRNAESFSGTLTYKVIDSDVIALDPFQLNGSAGTVYRFHGNLMRREGQRFTGVLESADLAVAYDSLYFTMEFTGLADNNGDGIPDIVDPSFDLGGDGLSLRVGELAWDYRVGYILAVNEDWAWSYTMGWVNYRQFPWLYHVDLGWMAFITHIVEANPANLRWFYLQQDGYLLNFDFASSMYFHFSSASGASGRDHVDGRLGAFPPLKK